ncbi:hypothetical protein NA56DRAFT_218494 [Hyaloscypha hepaticicola]|uniref:Uncharacterized protein n=1 Tax=Hyaloscypha hepaticicola TaxID=2082293 RepID=A0A2J6PXH2_9HELO|nr:hypothetical protein NA56DRAFT_218494 [Hyaloscypha hepaticicola]
MYGFYSGCCLIPGVVLVKMCCLVYTYFRNILVFGRLNLFRTESFHVTLHLHLHLKISSLFWNELLSLCVISFFIL